MADRLSWWVIPGALVVLTRVVTLGAPADDAPRGVAREAMHAEDVVVLQDATGRRTKPVSFAALTATALVVHLPATLAGRAAQITVWQHGARPVGSPWLQVEVDVGADGTVPIAGLAAGRYDVRATFASGQSFAATEVAAPGTCEPKLQATPAPVR